MKINILFLLLIIPCLLYGQDFFSNTNNKIDSAGKKQGYWTERKLKVKLNSFQISTSKIYLDEITELWYYKSAEGMYLNDEKVGEWITYSKCINYFDINILTTLGTLPTNAKDTTILEGFIYMDIDTLSISCDDINCIVKSSTNKIIKSFRREDLKTHLENFARCNMIC